MMLSGMLAFKFQYLHETFRQVIRTSSQTVSLIVIQKPLDAGMEGIYVESVIRWEEEAADSLMNRTNKWMKRNNDSNREGVHSQISSVLKQGFMSGCSGKPVRY